MDNNPESILKRVFDFDRAWESEEEPDISQYIDNDLESDGYQLIEELIKADLKNRQQRQLNDDPGIYASLGEKAVTLASIIKAKLKSIANKASTTGVDDKPPSQIGPYKLVHKLGEGGMGTVWLAEQHQPIRRQVAIKLIKASLATKEITARFEAERQALAMMDHPNIAKVLDAGTAENGSPYFVMELVQGIPINQYCDRRKLTPDARLDLFVFVCKAVQHAHQKGIIHRDLKPSNVLVQDKEGTPSVKVIDFGLAKALQHQTRLTDKTLFTEFGQVLGTLQYMSPEQAMMDALNVDTRSDIYSLGVMLYELLAGSTPIEQDTLNENALLKVLEVIREKDPPLPSQRLSSKGCKSQSISEQRQIQPVKLQRILKGELDWVVMKALEKDRSRRYETAEAFAADITRYLTGDPVLARPQSATYRMGKFVRKNKGLVASVVTIAALLIAGLGGTSWFAIESSREAARANREATRANEETERAVNAETLAKDEATRAKASAEQSARDQAAAERSAKRAKDSLMIFTDSFRSVDPSEGANADMLAKDVLFNAYETLKESDLDDKGRAQLLSALTRSFHGVGEYQTAILTGTEDVEIRDKLYGAEDPRTLVSSHNLAVNYSNDGQLRKSLELNEKILNGRKKVLGPEHIATMTTMDRLAQDHSKLGHLEKALDLSKEVWELRLNKLGKEHPDTIMSLANLAACYGDQGKHEDAYRFGEEALQLRRKILGHDHPLTLTSMNNLAITFDDLGRSKDALAIHQEVFDLRCNKLGPEHPKTLQSMNNLAVSHGNIGEHAMALKIEKQALEIRIQKQGRDHPETLTSMSNLASRYSTMGEIQMAIDLSKEVSDRLTQTLGADHPKTMDAKKNLVQSYYRSGQLETAKTLNQDLLKLLRQKLGNDHPTTLISMSDMSVIYDRLGLHQEAIDLNLEVIDVQRKRAGPEHPATLKAMGNLAVAYGRSGKKDKALEIAKQVLKLRQNTLGPEHPDTLTSMINLATDYYKAKDFEKALQMNEQAITLLRKTLGSDHPNTLSAMGNQALYYANSGQADKALELDKQVLDLRKLKLGVDHPETLKSMNNLAIGYRRQKNYQKSIPIFEEMVDLTSKREGEAHPTTLLFKVSLALNYCDVQRFDEAIPLYEEVYGNKDKYPSLKRFGKAMRKTYLLAKKSEKLLNHITELVTQARKSPDATKLDLELKQSGFELIQVEKFAEAEKLLAEYYDRKKKEDPESWSMFHAQSLLGAALTKQEKFEKAAPLLVKGFNELRKQSESIPEKERRQILLDAVVRLIDMAESTNDEDAAKKWQAEKAKLETEFELSPPPMIPCRRMKKLLENYIRACKKVCATHGSTLHKSRLPRREFRCLCLRPPSCCGAASPVPSSNAWMASQVCFD